MFIGADVSGSHLPRCTTPTLFNSIGKLLSFAQKSRREIVKTRYTVTLAITASFVLGALAAQALHAQATRPTYVVTIFDTEEVMKTNYPSLNPATFQPFGGHYIIHFGEMVTFDGQPPNQIVVIAFDSIANAKAWRASGAFKETYDINKIAKVRAFAVEGNQ
jgi:uncharacterized protein (DUF1330 family)